MDSLTNGPHRLRYITPEGGEDATSLYVTRVDGIGNPITASPSNPTLLDTENWWFSKGLDGKHWSILAQGPLPPLAGHGPVRLGFSHGVVKQGTPILYAAGLGEYIINHLADNQYTITVLVNDDAKSTYAFYVGKTLSGALELQEYPLQPSETSGVPKWSFEKV